MYNLIQIYKPECYTQIRYLQTSDLYMYLQHELKCHLTCSWINRGIGYPRTWPCNECHPVWSRANSISSYHLLLQQFWVADCDFILNLIGTTCILPIILVYPDSLREGGLGTLWKKCRIGWGRVLRKLSQSPSRKKWHRSCASYLKSQMWALIRLAKSALMMILYNAGIRGI